eukprot:2695588-Ditylum_brightwellii.AAC.1
MGRRGAAPQVKRSRVMTPSVGQHADTGDASGDKGVAVVEEQSEPGFGDNVYHGLGEEFFGVEEGAVH